MTKFSKVCLLIPIVSFVLAIVWDVWQLMIAIVLCCITLGLGFALTKYSCHRKVGLGVLSIGKIGLVFGVASFLLNLCLTEIRTGIREDISKVRYTGAAFFIASLREKFSCYRHDHGYLPNDWGDGASKGHVHTWILDPESEKSTMQWPRLLPFIYEVGSMLASRADMLSKGTARIVSTGISKGEAINADMSSNIPARIVPAHKTIWDMIDVCPGDLSLEGLAPQQFHYYVISATNNCSYAVACFGDGSHGLATGTGYAVCELNFGSRTFVGVWECYRSISDASVIFTTDPMDAERDGKYQGLCYVPSSVDFKKDIEADSSGSTIIAKMKRFGWRNFDESLMKTGCNCILYLFLSGVLIGLEILVCFRCLRRSRLRIIPMKDSKEAEWRNED